MKRKTEEITSGAVSEKGKDKRKRLIPPIRKRLSMRKKRRHSSSSLHSKSESVTSLASMSSIASCESVLSADGSMLELHPDVLDVTAILTPPPPATPVRTTSLTRSTTFFNNKKPALLPRQLQELREEEGHDETTPTNSPLPPPPPAANATSISSEEASLPLPPPIKGRRWTVSVALPGSICDNAQSPALRTYLAGQVARAISIFNVDEVVIFNDNPGVKVKGSVFEGVTKKTNPNVVLARILQYLETPQYLRKALFPRHPDLQYAGLLNPLDCPHHMREHEHSPYREGVVLKRPPKKGRGSFVEVGIDKEVQIDKQLESGMRVTVKMGMDYNHPSRPNQKHYKGTAVSPDAPRHELGTYWGYRVRLADTFSATFTESSYKEGYDLTIGTSDVGDSVDDVQIRHFKHVLIFFGGLTGLEPAIESDETLKETEPRTLFDYYLNVCPDQGSRTIRTEEALFITLGALRKQLSDNGMN